MAVTDLTDALPWWARQGPGPTGGPAATPSGGAGPPGAQGMGWLQYLSQMFGPNSAQAADDPQIAQLKAALAAQAGGAPPQAGPADIQAAAPIQAAINAAPPQGAMPSRPAGVSATGLPLQSGSLSPGALSQFASAAGGPIGSGGYAPWPSGGGSMNQTAPPPQGQQAPGAPVQGPLAGGGASAAGATSNPRFIGIDRPNAPAEGGGGMARGGGLQGTALNLAGLFGRGGVNPNAPAANAQAVSALRGPLAKGKAWPMDMGPFTPDQAAARGLKQRYG